MNKPLVVAALFLVPGCGRTLEAGGTETDSDGSTGSSSGDASVTITTTMTSTSASTTDATSDSTTLSTTDATTDMTTGVDSSGTTTGGGGGGCCEVHDAPSCDEEEAAACVCAASPECCVFGWDQACVDLATGECAATCMGGGSSSSTGGAVACDSTMEIELGATDAVLDGTWAIQMSQQGEGMIAAIPMGEMGSGTVTWSIDVPCDDDWHIWVRAVDFGSNDSFFARLDGGPDPAPIFELACDNFGQGYLWRELNQRDPENGGPCEYVEDPWVASWATGTHEFQLEFRESIAVARIVVTNDDTYVPM